MTLTKKRDLDKYAHVHKGKSLRVMTGCTTVFSSNHSYHHDDEVTRHQGYATRCNRFARKWKENEEMKRKWRENQEMKRKWRENQEMKRKWRENEEMERFSLSTFHHSLCISSLSIPFLYQTLSHFVAKCQIQHFCRHCHKKKLNISAMRKYFWVVFDARKFRQLCQPARYGICRKWHKRYLRQKILPLPLKFSKINAKKLFFL